MGIVNHRARSLCAATLTLLVSSRAVHAQVCFGTPSHGGISYDRGAAFAGYSNGATATVAGQHVAFSVGGRVLEKVPASTTQSGDARFSLQFGASRVTVCPGLGIGYRHSVWDAPANRGVDFNVTTHAVAARAGVSVGIEQPVYRGASIIPFVGARYAFRLYYLDTKATSGAVSASGDTTSSMEIEYGLTVRYSLVYLGWSALHDTDRPGTRPIASRLFVGVTWGSGKRKDAAGS